MLDAPAFVYGSVDVTDPEDGTNSLVLGLPSGFTAKSMVSIGGDIEGDSGARAAYVIHRNELITLTLRFFETQWSDITAWIDQVMNGQIFMFFPTANPNSGLFESHRVRLESPAPGTAYNAQPDPQYARVLMITVTLRSVTTFDAIDVYTPTTQRVAFGRGPDTGKSVDTLYHNEVMTVGSVTITWPNYVVPSNSPGWQGVVGTGGSSANPQDMVFQRLVKRVSVDFEEITFYDNWMAAYDENDVEIGRCTLTLAYLSTHTKTAIIEFPTNRIKKIRVSGNGYDWVTWDQIVVDRDFSLSEL